MDLIRGHYLVSIIYKSVDLNGKVNEYNSIKNKIAKLLYEEGYQYIIGDECLIQKNINEK